MQETKDVVKDNECGRHRQMQNVYAFSFWNLNEFFIAIHKKSINISPGESEGEKGGRERKKDPYGMSCHESPLKQKESPEKKKTKEEGRRRDGGMFMPRTQTPTQR